MIDFIQQNNGKCFRYWIKKRMWTPYELSLKDPHQSDLEDDTCSYGYFVECVNLGYDWLIGITEDSPEPDYVHYYKLSEIEFAYSVGDQD